VSGWHARGRYVEACNCEAICPCRSVGGRDGSRAQFQLCQFIIAWTIDDGHYDGLDLAGLQAVMAGYWDEDEVGAPWRVALYVDGRASEPQSAALASIFLGRSGGTPAANYAQAIKAVLGVEAAEIEVSHAAGAQRIRAGDAVLVMARAPFQATEAVSCGIPGHDHPGQELVHEVMRVSAGALDFEFRGRCGFATDFDYRGDRVVERWAERRNVSGLS
jgi:hypothetical protein